MIFSEFGFLEKSTVEVPAFNAGLISDFFSEDLNSKMVVFTAYANKHEADKFREELYNYHFDSGVEFVDIGNVQFDLSHDRKMEAIKVISSIILKQNCLPIFISPNDRFCFAMYEAFEDYEQWVSVCEVSGTISMNSEEDFLVRMLSHQPNYLFNYAHLSAQSYYVPEGIKETLRALNFEEIRLGNLRGNTQSAEPLLRIADYVILNLNALKFSELHSDGASPNGLYAEDICQLAMYAGLSDQCNGLAIVNPYKESTSTAFALISQMFWCFSGAVVKRLGDYPVGDYSNYMRYDVLFEKEDRTLVFYKSNVSERWWLKTPDGICRDNNFKRHALIACNENDYLESASGKLPKVWWTEILK